MRKYIFTESQIKSVIDNIVLEEKILNESDGIYNLAGIAEIIARIGIDEETMLDVLKNIYQSGGDEAIQKLVKDHAGFEIEPVSKGHYVIK